MTAQSKSRLQGAAFAVFAAAILTQCSCNLGIEMDPATTVTVKITGLAVGGDQFAVVSGIEERLQAMAESDEPLMTSSASGGNMTVKLSPVGDVSAFARQISFGEVTDVEGRTVMVRFLK
jgi:hypothetical protein